MGLLKESSRKYSQTILMVTHNEALAQACDRIIRIEDGRLYERKKESEEPGRTYRSDRPHISDRPYVSDRSGESGRTAGKGGDRS